ncbi:MAG: cytochrome c [Aggregatilineales bacterium]
MQGTRSFFAGSLLISGVLIVLMLGRVFAPQDVPDAVGDGYAVWQENGCIGCHTLYGQGGAYAPDITHIYSQRGSGYLSEFFINPGAFHPDARVMPRFGLTQSETDNLLAFMAWIDGNDEVSDWSPRSIAVSGMGGLGEAVTVANQATIVDADPAVTRGRALFSRAPAICSTCHSLEPDITLVGPSLYGIADSAGTRIAGVSPQDYIRESILNPGDYLVDGFVDVMQKNFAEVLTSDNINDLIAFLMTLEDALAQGEGESE